MTSMDDLNTASFAIIAAVGEARSLYIEAIHAAKTGDYERAAQLKSTGEQAFLKGHEAHASLIQQEAAGEPTTMTLMLAHAEDQLMSAEQFGILADEFIDVFRRLDGRVLEAL